MRREHKEWWQEAALETYEGLLDRTVPHGFLSRPSKVFLDMGDELFWQYSPGEGTGGPVTPAGMLSEFVRLDQAPAERIVEYAKQWGVLGLDQDGGFLQPRWKDWDYRWGSEPISAWRNHAAKIRRALNLAAKIEGVDIPESDWRDDVTDVLLEPYRGYPLMHPYMLQQRLVQYVNEWMRQGEVRFQLTWPRDYWRNLWDRRSGWEFDSSVLKKGPQYSLLVSYPRGLFSALAFQVCLAVTKSHGLYLCSGCGYPYLRGSQWKDETVGYPEQLGSKRRNLTRRRPKKTTDNYCEECVANRIPQKRAKARYLAKQKT